MALASMDGVTVTGYEKPYVIWRDSAGIEGKSDIRKAHGKMPWRVDWAARWAIHGITCEPAGKDHGAAGGVMTPDPDMQVTWWGPAGQNCL